MSVLSEIFTPSFFMILAIVFILMALLVIYIENKWREQNHKIASMLSLVSSLAEEINVLRFNFITYANKNASETQVTSSLDNNEPVESHLIPVSDDEEDEEEEEEDDDYEDDEDDNKTSIIKLNISDDDNEDEDEDEDNVNDVIDIGQGNDIKILKVNMENFENEEMEDEENDLADFDAESISDLETLDSASEEKSKTVDLKSISISHLEETKQNEPAIDYKKLPLPKLKSIVSEKGLISDASKLKKNELLALLGVVV